MIGITCAIDKEFREAATCLTGLTEQERSGEFEIILGTVGPVNVVVVRHGTGKAAAAAAAQLIIERHHPRALINFGAAGSLVDDLRVGDVVVAEKLYQGDVGVVHGEGFRHTGAACHQGMRRCSCASMKPTRHSSGLPETWRARGRRWTAGPQSGSARWYHATR